MLKGNNNKVSGIRWFAGGYAALKDTTFDQNKIYNNGLAFGMKVGKPYGYNGLNGILLPQKRGGFIRATLSGSGSFTPVISSIANMFATMMGEGTSVLNANLAFNMYCDLIGESRISADLKAKAWMSATMDAGARPSAFDIAQEIWQSRSINYNSAGTMGAKVNAESSSGNPWDAIIEGSITAEEALRIILSVLAGKTNITNTTVKFRDIADTKDRVTATVSKGNRTSIILDKT